QRTCTVHEIIPDFHMFFIIGDYRKVLPDYIQYLCFYFLQIKLRPALIIYGKSMADIRAVIVWPGNVLHTVSKKIFSTVSHLPVYKRAESNLGNIVRRRSEKRRPGNDNLFSNSDQQVCISL